MNIIELYQQAKQALYDHVGFIEDWTTYPIANYTDSVWYVTDDELVFADTHEELLSEQGNCYSGPINKDRFYSKWVYEGSEFTMVMWDSQTDGMDYLAFFRNDLRRQP